MGDKYPATLRRFIQDESGATAVEYAMMLVLIILVCIATVAYLGRTTEGSFNKFLNAYDSLAPK